MSKSILKITIFLAIFNAFSPYLYTKNRPQTQQAVLPICLKELAYKKKVVFNKLVYIPALIFSVCLLFQNSFIQSIKDNPILIMLTGSLLLNFILDAHLQYKRINQTLYLFKIYKKISRFLLFATALKNTMHQMCKNDPECPPFSEDEYFNIITQDIPLSFQELETLIFELLHNCIKSIHALHIKIHTDIEEQIYLLAKERIQLQEIQQLYVQDPDLYDDLQDLLQNPGQHYKKTAFKLNSAIKRYFKYMMQQHHHNN